MDLYYDRQGQPITRDRWVELRFGPAAGRQRDRRHRVARTRLGRDAGELSTVWLGMDLGFGQPAGRPLLFESMVFGGPWDGYMARYATEREAIAGHARIVQMMRGVRFNTLIHNGGRPPRGRKGRLNV